VLTRYCSNSLRKICFRVQVGLSPRCVVGIQLE
jgi:hypothetical protein